MEMLIALPFIAVVVFVAALFLSLGAGVAGIDGRSYGKAIISVVVCAVAGAILGGVLSLVGLKQGIVPLGLSIAMNLFVIKSVFTTSWGKAFIAWFIQMVLTIIVIAVPLMFLFGAAILFG